MRILDKIREFKVEELSLLKQQVSTIDLEQCAKEKESSRDFLGALLGFVNSRRTALIAEIKKASPTRGIIRPDFDVSAIAQSYEKGGAACLSILTDTHFFKGHPEYISLAKECCRLPVLRKDFIIDPYQIVESRVQGADCILLILDLLDKSLALELETQAMELGLDVLIEVHNEAQVEIANQMKSRIIGINNRDMSTFKADLSNSERLSALVKPEAIVVSESGIAERPDIVRLKQAGIYCYLIGESLMRAPDIYSETVQFCADKNYATS